VAAIASRRIGGAIMKIAFVGGFAFSPKGTIQSRAFPLAVELVHQGHEVDIFLPPYDNLKDSGKQWTQEGVRISNVTVSPSPLSYPPALASLLRNVEAFGPDLVHIFKPKGFSGAAGTYLLLRRKYPVVVDCDDWEGWGGWNEGKSYPWLAKEYIDLQEQWMMRSAPALTVASRVLQERALTARSNATDVYYVPNCGASRGKVAAQAFARSRSQLETRRALGLPDEGVFVLYSGHFERNEDATFFCRAAASVADRNRAGIVFTGEGPLLPVVRRFFLSPNNPKVYFFPQLAYEKFVQLVWACDVAAFPYPDDLVHRAKCSARILDYMAMEKPVLTSAVGQNREYIVDGESGLLAAASDEQAFAGGLDLLLKDPDLRARLGKNAAERIRQKFTWNTGALQQCLAAYRHVSPPPQLACTAGF
jgi:glycosyltransferase involved in cell wall biosynthesis